MPIVWGILGLSLWDFRNERCCAGFCVGIVSSFEDLLIPFLLTDEAASSRQQERIIRVDQLSVLRSACLARSKRDLVAATERLAISAVSFNDRSCDC